jgi:hypothetical protein
LRSASVIIAHAQKIEGCRHLFRRVIVSRSDHLPRPSGGRLFRLHFLGDRSSILAGLARHGQPIQYAHVKEPLALYDVWTKIAADPTAFEPPSAGFALDWRTQAHFGDNAALVWARLPMLQAFRRREILLSIFVSPSTNPIGFRDGPRQQLRKRRQKTGV